LEEAETTILDDETTATGSSVTLSTKRSFDDFDEDNNEELAEESASRPTSPGKLISILLLISVLIPYVQIQNAFVWSNSSASQGSAKLY